MLDLDNAVDYITFHLLEYKKKTGYYPAELRISKELFEKWNTNIYLLDRYNNLAFFELREDKQKLTLEDINYILKEENLPTKIVIFTDNPD